MPTVFAAMENSKNPKKKVITGSFFKGRRRLSIYGRLLWLSAYFTWANTKRDPLDTEVKSLEFGVEVSLYSFREEGCERWINLQVKIASHQLTAAMGWMSFRKWEAKRLCSS